MLDNLNVAVKLLVLIIEGLMEKGCRKITHDLIAQVFTIPYDETIRGTGSRRSAKENMIKALDYMVREGHVYAKDDSYICAYKTLDQFREAKYNIMDEDRLLSYELSIESFLPKEYNVYRLDMTSRKSDLDTDDDSDYDDIDLEEIIKFRKEMYDEPATSDSKKDEDDSDEDDDDLDELDKLLKELFDEMKIQTIIKSTEDAKALIVRRCETKDEAKKLCYEMCEGISGETILHFFDAYIYFESISNDEYIEFKRENE